MALAQAAPPQLCDYCHQRQQHSQHKYCSKTCAAQASGNASNKGNLCTQCQKKPKFQNFEFCGKSCASQATGKPSSKGSNGAAQQPSSSQPGINPIQVAHFIAQQVPQVKAFLAAVNGTSAQAVGPAPVNQAPPHAPIAPQNNPFLQLQSHAPVLAGTNGTPPVSKSPPAAQQPPVIGAQQPVVAANNVECLIPGCGKPVHTDTKGMKTSDYCSKRHREEAVTSGIASACIMCGKFPQGEKDYFCSRMCREEALAKMPQ